MKVRFEPEDRLIMRLSKPAARHVRGIFVRFHAESRRMELMNFEGQETIFLNLNELAEVWLIRDGATAYFVQPGDVA